jgi:hypothetical protein
MNALERNNGRHQGANDVLETKTFTDWLRGTGGATSG